MGAAPGAYMPCPRKPAEVLKLTDTFFDSPADCPPIWGLPCSLGYPPVQLTPDEASALYDFVHNTPVGRPTSKQPMELS